MNKRQEGGEIQKPGAEDKRRKKPLMEDGVQTLLLDESVRKHNVRLRRIHIEMENHDLTAFRKGRRQTADEMEKLGDEMMRHQQEEYMRQNQEDVAQRKLQKLSEAEGWGEQVKEKQLLRQQEKLDKLKDVQICDDLILQEEERRRQAAQDEAESKKRKLKSQLEEICTRRRNREVHLETLKMEEEKARAEQRQHAERALQIKRKQSALFRERQIPSQIVSELLARSKEERASAVATREEQVFLRAVAQREAEYAEQQKKKEEEEEAARIQALSSYACCMQKKEEQKQAEQQNAVGELQVQMEADRVTTEEDKLKALRVRQKNVCWQDINRSTAAERRRAQQQRREEELDSAVKKEEAVALKASRLHQQAQKELHKAEEKLRRKRRQDVQPETDGVPERPGQVTAQPQDAKLLLRGVKLETKRPAETNRVVLQDNSRVVQNSQSTAPRLPPIQLAKKAAFSHI